MDAELSRLGRLTMDESGDVNEFCLDDVLRRLVVAQQAQGRSVSWKPSGATVVGRADDLTEALHVLLDNAAKHGRTRGRRSTSASTTTRRDPGVRLRSGDLSRASRPRVFEWGARGDGSGGTASGCPSRATWSSSRAAPWRWTTPLGPERPSSSAYWQVSHVTQAATARGDLRILIIEDHVLLAESLGRADAGGVRRPPSAGADQ